MSQLAKQLFSAAKDMAHGIAQQAGAAAQNVVGDVSSEIAQKAKLGAQELASALFSGHSNAFVLYGGKERAVENQQQQEQQPERGGMER